MADPQDGAPSVVRRVTAMSLDRVAEPFRRHPRIADAVLGVALGVLFLTVPAIAGDGIPDGRAVDLLLSTPETVLTVVLAAALTQWRRYPGPTLGLVGTVVGVGLVAGWDPPIAAPVLMLTMYAYAVRAPRTRALLAALAMSVGLTVAGLWRGAWDEHDGLAVLLWASTATAVTVQARRATITALEDRARRAEESREATALRRVAEDRVRIARELHDVIAHHVAVVSVQSGVAGHLVERDPAGAREALGHVRGAARAVLTELQSVLGVLRQDETALPTAPAPGLSGLDDLVESARTIGTRVTVTASGPPPVLTPAADVAAYRLVQEALTNVQKHAPGATAAVRVETDAAVVVVEVTNARPPRGPSRTPSADGADDEGPTGWGLGLVGMRERVQAAGGSLEAGATEDGGFRVAARLPRVQEDR